MVFDERDPNFQAAVSKARLRRYIARTFIENSFVDNHFDGDLLQTKSQAYQRVSMMLDLKHQAQEDIHKVVTAYQLKEII